MPYQGEIAMLSMFYALGILAVGIGIGVIAIETAKFVDWYLNG